MCGNGGEWLEDYISGYMSNLVKLCFSVKTNPS